MYGRPVVLTSLQEDMRRLGLLQEEGPETPGPSGEPTSTPEAPGRNVGAMSEKPSNQGKDTTDKVEPHAGAVPPPAKLPVTPGSQVQVSAEGITGEPDKIRAGDVRAKGGTTNDMAGQTGNEGGNVKSGVTNPMAGQAGQDAKPMESVLPGALSVKEAVARIRTSTQTNEGNTPMDRIADLLAGASSVIEALENAQRSEAVKAFANTSLIAEMLYTGYAGFAYKYQDAELAEAAEALQLMAADARDIALALESGEALDRAGVEAEFRTQMDALISGMDLYADIVEADSDEDDDDEDDDDKKSDKPGGDKDPEDREEAVRFRTPLIKKGGTATRPTTGAGAALGRLNMSRTEGKGWRR